MIVDEMIARIGLEFSGAQNALKAISSVRNIKTELAAVGGVIFALEGALKAVAISVAETVDEYADFGAAVGASVETIETLTAAAQMNGGSFEDVQRGLKTLTDQAGAAAKGNQEAADKFGVLGVSIFNANGHIKTADQLIDGVADGLAKMKDPASQVNAAIDVLGKGAIKLLPALTNGRRGLQGFRAEMEKIGVVMTENANNRFRRLGDSIDMLKLRATGAKNILAQAFLPFAESTIDKLNGFLEKSAGSLFDFGQRFASLVTAPFALFLDIVKALPTELTALLLGGAALLAIFTVPAAAVLFLSFLIAALAEDIKAFLDGQESQLGDAIAEWENFKFQIEDLAKTTEGWAGSLARVLNLLIKIGAWASTPLFGEGSEGSGAAAGGIWDALKAFTGPKGNAPAENLNVNRFQERFSPLANPAELPARGFVFDPSRAPAAPFDFAGASKGVTINAPMTINAANMSDAELSAAIERGLTNAALEIQDSSGASK